MDSQSLRGEDIAASLILHWTGWSVWRSTVMLFPSTLGLSLIRFTTCPAKWSATSNTQYPTHYTPFYGCVKYTLHCTRKRVSSAPCLGGHVRDSLPATYTLRIFLWSPEDISGTKITCWVIDIFEEYEPIYQSITVSPDCLMQTWKGS